MMRAVVYLLESWTFLTPGTLVVLCFYIWSCPILHREGHCLFNHIGTVVSFKEEINETELKCVLVGFKIQNVATQSKIYIKMLSDAVLTPDSMTQIEREDLLVSAGGFPLVVVLHEPSFILVELKRSVELSFNQ